ncbi:MAG: geranylgeranyl reductase family protein [Candidatus Thorarchaeota archaeon]|nr:geranylgeranyl reductase family protein [Candidatus Thorarchaeota archaeon]
MTDYDIIVVGGGPAGSTAARRAVQQGLSVLLLDKEHFPRVKPCGGGFTDHVENALDFSIEEVIQRRVYGQTIFSPSGIVVDCVRPEPSGSMVMRTEFDHLLLNKAEEAGAEVKQGERVVKASDEGNQVIVSTDSNTYTGKYLVGADGINSVVAKSLGFYKGWLKDSAAVCVEVEAEVGEEAVKRICGVPHHEEGVSIHIYFGPVPYGYAWCFPKRSILSFGAGCRQDKVQNLRGQFDEWFDKFKKTHNIDPQIVSDTSARVPFKEAAKTTVKGRTILVGDAAGFVNPYDAEGVMMAVKSGIIAAPVLKEAVEASNPVIMKKYEKAWKAEFNNTLKVGKKVAKLLFKSEKNMETICRLGAKDPVMNDVMYKMIAGLENYKTLYRTMIKRILTKHPKAGLSLYT